MWGWCRWLRSGRYSRKAVATPTQQETIALAAEAAAEQERYDELKAQLQAWCLGTTVVCFIATLAFYSKVTASAWHPCMYLCQILHGVQLFARLLGSCTDLS